MAARNVVLGFSFVSAALFATMAGCGGIDEPDLFDTSGTTTTSDAGSKADAKASTDSGTTTKPDSGTTLPDAGGNPPPKPGASVDCGGGDVCDSNEDTVCCFSPEDKAGECVSGGADTNCPNDGEITIPCDDTADCDALGFSGDLCCVTVTGNGSGSAIASDVQCRPASDCKTSNNQTNLCDPNSTDPCPNGGACQISAVSVPNFYICR
ncbi:MAG TPA: hypothetical protein VF407_18730 [Polyangiaceae bacterium]